MSALFKKLNLKEQKSILVYNAPESFEPELAALRGLKIARDPKAPRGVEFALAFATTQKELDRLSQLLAAGAQGDAVLWFAYPKGTSRRYRCEFNRDNGWGVIRALGKLCTGSCAGRIRRLSHDFWLSERCVEPWAECFRLPVEICIDTAPTLAASGA